MGNKKDDKKKEKKFTVKNYDANGEYIEDISKVVLPLEMSKEIYSIISNGINSKNNI